MKGYCIFSQIHEIHEVKSVTLMHRIRAWQRLWRVMLSLSVANSFVTSFAEEISFNRDIRPILSANCFSCHGPDKKARKAKLRLDTQEGTLADLGGYRALEPGKADDSELILRIESNDPDEIMPPPDSGHELTDNDRKVLRQWVNAGGEYETHWSFNRPVKTPFPKTKKKDWILNPLDHFVLNKLESNGREPSRDLDRHRWIRRVSLDLTGKALVFRLRKCVVIDRHVPLPGVAGNVAIGPESFRYGDFLQFHSAAVPRVHDGMGQLVVGRGRIASHHVRLLCNGRVPSAHDGATRRGAGWGRRIALAEEYSLLCQSIDVRGLHGSGSIEVVALHVLPT